jgi:predicted unusual protein kinase regulating ubiquinone biosynthesis (AarF/ABC1/UbiB family)
MSSRGHRARNLWLTIGGVAAIGTAAVARSRRRKRNDSAAIAKQKRTGRNTQLASLGVKVGATYASTSARKLFASAERRIELDRDRELKTAEQIADRLGQMKGALMKLGQMASYLHEGLPEPLRIALSSLQSDAPPMSFELAKGVIERELGQPIEDLFVTFDPEPIAAASIGQVHRAIIIDPATGDERAVAVKVQYPGVDVAIRSDLRNTEVLGAILKQGFGGLDPSEMVEEIKTRLSEELDYALEARNQRAFHAYYREHPYFHVPEVIDQLSTSRVLTTELVVGSSWSELLTWDQRERDLAAEAIFRFVFRSLYRFKAFNGDPHPGNYLFHGDGRVTFLDFGLVKHFTDTELSTFESMVKAAAIDHDHDGFRRIVEDAGLLKKHAPIDTIEAGEYFSHFYQPVSEDRVMTWTSEYSSNIVRHTFDRESPISQYATVPKSFVFIQRINLGLYAILGELGATGNYRRVAEELWPMVNGGPSTPMGAAEAEWLLTRRPDQSRPEPSRTDDVNRP